jgi:hypothetical protein
MALSVYECRNSPQRHQTTTKQRARAESGLDEIVWKRCSASLMFA